MRKASGGVEIGQSDLSEAPADKGSGALAVWRSMGGGLMDLAEPRTHAGCRWRDADTKTADDFAAPPPPGEHRLYRGGIAWHGLAASCHQFQWR